MDVVPTALARPARRRYSPTLLLLAAAAAHLALGLYEGLFDGGDYSLLYLAAPLMGLTVLAAVCCALDARWAPTAAVVLTGVTAMLALLLVQLYLVGVFHLPQSVLAVVVASKAAARA